MKYLWVIALPLALGGCHSELSRAAKRHETAERVDDHQAACQAAKDAMDAALTAGSDSDYKEWRQTANADCNIVKIEELNKESRQQLGLP